MLRKYISAVLLMGALILGLVPLAIGPDAVLARATGVVATITALDGSTGEATLTTETGEVFTIALPGPWKVGDRVECDRVDDAPQIRLQRCQPWQ